MAKSKSGHLVIPATCTHAKSAPEAKFTGCLAETKGHLLASLHCFSFKLRIKFPLSVTAYLLACLLPLTSNWS